MFTRRNGRHGASPPTMRLLTAAAQAGRFIVCMLLCACAAYAQTITGTISGTVVDSSGQVIPACAVALINERTGDSRNGATNEAGVFTFPAVQPGTYTVRIEHPGFQVFQKTGNVLTANERLSVGTLTLKIGSVTETVSVTSEGAAVQTDSSEHSALLTSNQLNMIAVRGRDIISMLRILPGVSYQGESESPGGGFGTGTPNIQGTRNNWNSVTVDGLAGNDLGSPSVFSSTINLDAIGEVKVLLNNYRAEYGRNAGAFINMVTKSGTRDYHGSAYGYVRNEALNANDFFNNRNGLPKSLYRYNTVGFTFGGPIFIPKLLSRSREKLFFFYSFEDSQTKIPQPLRQVTVPTTLERAGDFSQSLDLNGRLITIRDPLTGGPFVGNLIPTGRIDPNGLAVLNIFPLPNALDRRLTNGTYNYVFRESLNVPKWNHVFRIDYRPNEKDSFYARGMLWYADNQGYAVPAGSSNWGLVRQHYTFTDNGVVFDHTHVFSPTVVNEVSIGARHSIEKGPPLSPAELDRVRRPQIGLNIGQFFPEFNPLGVIPQASFGGVPNAAAISYDGRFPLRGADTVINITDGLTVNRGRHTIKVGVDIDRARNYEGETGTFAGNFSFARDVNNPLDTNYAYSNALLGYFQSYTESSSRPRTEGRQTLLDWYVQDTWKATRKLTLDYGVRFAWYTQNKQNDFRAAAFSLERYDRTQAPQFFRPSRNQGARVAVNPVTGEIGPDVLVGAFVPGTGNPSNGMVAATDTNYPAGFMDRPPVLPEPRVGFSYDPFGDGKTAIRGGFGLFHNTRPPGALLRSLTQNPPVQFNPRIFYGSLGTFLNSTGVLFPSNVVGLDRRNKTPSVYNFSLGIQRDIGFATVVDVSYVGSLGRHLDQSRNINLIPYGARFLPANADPTNPSTPLPDNFFRPFPGLGDISYRENASSSSYHALQVAANRRFVRGLQLGVAYTWSKTMDYTDADGGGVAVYRPLRIWNYGKAGFDQTHVFVVNYAWELPRASARQPNPIVRYLFDDWQVSGITAFASGTPSGVGFGTTDVTDITGGGDGARIVVTGPVVLPRGDRSLQRWFDTSAFARPARGDVGNAPKDVFRSPGINNWDVAFFKKIPLGSERWALQFRWEIYNVFNHTQFAGVDSTARFDPAGTQVNQRFGQVISTRSPRVMQGSMRLSF